MDMGNFALRVPELMSVLSLFLFALVMCVQFTVIAETNVSIAVVAMYFVFLLFAIWHHAHIRLCKLDVLVKVEKKRLEEERRSSLNRAAQASQPTHVE